MLAALVAAGTLGLTACGHDAGRGSRVAEGTARFESPNGQETVQIHAIQDHGAVSGRIDVRSEEGRPFSVEVR
jgi:hypothetical protein